MQQPGKYYLPKARALDAVEAGAIHIENEINCCVGLGGYPDRDGIVTLDSCIMDEYANCGAVAGLERIKHPVSVARKVMEKTPHVILVGRRCPTICSWKMDLNWKVAELSECAKKAYADWLKKSEYKPVINIENKKQTALLLPIFLKMVQQIMIPWDW